MAALPLSLKCPKCGSASVRRTRSTTLDRILSVFGLKAVKCRECRLRFRTRFEQLQVVEKKSESGRSESTRRRRAARRREIQVYGFALIAFLLMLYMITRERG